MIQIELTVGYLNTNEETNKYAVVGKKNGNLLVSRYNGVLMDRFGKRYLSLGQTKEVKELLDMHKEIKEVDE